MEEESGDACGLGEEEGSDTSGLGDNEAKLVCGQHNGW